jgi:voltage-gated potassium channel Kch
MTHDLTVRFLGVRGSIATPGMAAGGNTACVEVVAGDTRIILDAGTGLRALGDERMAAGIRHSTILLSHLHWDHVAGLQFFTPVYVPGFTTVIAGGPNGVMSHDEAIRSLFRAPFFPVDFDDLGGTVATRELRANDRFQLGDVTITALPGRHGPRLLRPLVGPVTSFLVTSPAGPSLYVSGDNSSLARVREHATRIGPVDIAFLFAGAARVAPLPVPLTLTSAKAAEAAHLLGARAVVGVHVEDWAHFSESRADLEKAFTDAGLHELLVDTPRGDRVAIEL